ncbi:MAG: hypothetical protein ABJZ55_22910 [Fuerstiella sp.]
MALRQIVFFDGALKRCTLIFTAVIVALSPLRDAVGQQDSFGGPPINYMSADVNDPVAQLQAKLDDDSIQLQFDDRQGYLSAVLKALQISPESQTLVFSKTSLQLSRISPRVPRALYFNDDVYVGWCQRGDVLELAATDAKQGAMFYTLEQSVSRKPKFVRDKGQCLSCHASGRTQNVPGYLMRSVTTEASGRPVFGNGTSTTTDRSPFEERWGGWYVTGSHGSMRHMGNALYREETEDIDRNAHANRTSLSDLFRTTPYLTEHSDIVALMVLQHQTQMHNAIAAANYESRQAVYQSLQMNQILDRPEGFLSDTTKRRIARVSEKVVQHLLFCDEYQLTSNVTGTSAFQSHFEATGVSDSGGRSLRQFDLSKRLFRYPCSYLIYSNAFSGLPDIVRSKILARLKDVLVTEDAVEGYEHLSLKDRTAIDQILMATVSEYRALNGVR